MEELSAIKKQLKVWEGVFLKENGRKPGKEDIANAPTDIKGFYRNYYSLKRSLSEQTEESKKENIQNGSDADPSANQNNGAVARASADVWGAHLNKRKTSVVAEQEARQKAEEGASFMKNLGKKLLENASHSSSQSSSQSSQLGARNSWGIKRTPNFSANGGQKASSFSHKPRNPSSVSNLKLSPGSHTSDDEDNIEVTSSVFALGLKIAKKKKANESLSFQAPEDNFNSFVSQIQRRKSEAAKLQNKYRNVSLDAMETGTSDEGQGLGFHGIISQEHNAMSSFDDAKHTAPLRHTKCTTSPQNTSRDAECSRKFPVVHCELSEPPFPISQNTAVPVPIPSRDPGDSKGWSPGEKQSRDTDTKADLKSESIQRNNGDVACVKKKKISPERKFKEISKFTQLKADTSYSQIKPDNAPTMRIAHSRKRKASDSQSRESGARLRNVRAKLERNSGDSQHEDSDSMFIDVGWRPSSRQEEVMIELDGGSMEGNSEGDVYDGRNSGTENSGPENVDDTPPEVTRKKAARKRDFGPSKVSNDNFVRLNMKAKKYVRKGNFRSGSAHKRFAWKQKMKARSESFGSSKCFKCGQEGHWAKKCKGPAKGRAVTSSFDSSQADDNTVDDADFPSLSQAFNMARGIKPDQSATTKTARNSGKSKANVGAKDGADLDKEPSDVNASGGDGSDDEDPEIIRTAYESVPPPPAMDPLYPPLENGDIPDLPRDVYKALNKFGFQEFRAGQEKAIKRVLCGMSTLVVLSTGAGKSLCYQLPAYMYAQRSTCITLVISPLVSLMEDQVAGLPPGIKGACLHTNMTKGQREKVTEAVTRGDVHFLLISPEALVGGGSRGCLPGVSSLPPIAFACIDEAHCLSEWSHHFRPSYLRICKILKEKFGVKCILGLTATATMVTAASVSKHLGIHDYQTATIRGLPVPSNLYLSVSRDEDRDEALITLLQGDRFANCNSIIIYCTRREETDRVATLIRTCLKDLNTEEPASDLAPEPTPKGKGRGRKPKKPAKPKSAGDAECYHAGLSAAARRRVQNAFMSGRLRIVVATVAFGMGLDKRDVRGIVHYNLPKSFESYVQEIGRAGRDGQPAHCHLFLDPRSQDMQELKRHIYSNTVDRVTIKKLVRKVFPPCRCRELRAKHEQTTQQSEHEYDCSEPWEDVGKTADDKRVCPGHERTMSIESTVQLLDMREEGISTLLCYLELHPQRWVENLQNVYGTCAVQCYGGPRQLQQIAKQCPPVAVAIAQQKKCGISHARSNKLEFSVVDVSDSMGWESGPVKRELKMLQWTFGVNGPEKTGVLVEFSDLSFHLRSVGDLTNEEVDGIVGFLAERMETQERTELGQLQNFHDILHSVSHKNVWMCSEKVDETRSDKLKSSIFEYFEEQPELEHGQITMLSFAREMSSQEAPLIHSQVRCENEDYVRADIRAFIQIHGSEHQLTGRAIARVFHGIPSPCFPAEVWGRVRRFWRSHLAVDFNLLRKMATIELVQLK